MSRPKDLIKTSEARKLLGVSSVKIAQMIRDGIFRTFDNPLDKRLKLVSRAEVEKLAKLHREAA